MTLTPCSVGFVRLSLFGYARVVQNPRGTNKRRYTKHTLFYARKAGRNTLLVLHIINYKKEKI